MQERGYPASAGFLFLALLCVCAYQSAQNQHRGRNTQWAGTQMPAHFNRSVEGASAHSHATGGDMSMMPMYFVSEAIRAFVSNTICLPACVSLFINL